MPPKDLHSDGVPGRVLRGRSPDGSPAYRLPRTLKQGARESTPSHRHTWTRTRCPKAHAGLAGKHQDFSSRTHHQSGPRAGNLLRRRGSSMVCPLARHNPRQTDQGRTSLMPSRGYVFKCFPPTKIKQFARIGNIFDRSGQNSDRSGQNFNRSSSQK